METLSKDQMSFLDSTQGKVFLSTKKGRKFLQNDISIQWLVTQMGRNWVESPDGHKWLFEEKDTRISCFLHKGLSLLTCPSLQSWLIENESGKHWLHTGHGVLWLQKSEDGQKWLESPAGIKWLKVPIELLDLVKT